MADLKGSSAHAAQHVHGVVPRKEPPAPQTVEQRVAKLEARVAALEAQVPPVVTTENDKAL